ncbi:MAG: site-specific integrase [Candidatus Eisenbacteria sp.]|nr:site-specific integrase [Candidatus Eisenbacteria bacterium]
MLRPSRPYLYRRGDNGPWYYRRRVKEGDKEKRINKSLGRDRREAIRKARRLDAKYGEFGVLPARVSLGCLAAEWLEVYVRTARNAKGQRIAEQRVRDYVKPHLGERLAGELGQNDLRRFRAWLESQPASCPGEARAISAQTVRHVLADLRCLLRWAEEEGHIKRAPIPRRWLPTVPPATPKPLTDGEVDLVTSLPDPWGFVCRLGLATGLRWGDLISIRADQIANGVLVHQLEKTGAVVRIPLEDGILAELKGRVGKLVQHSSAGSFRNAVRRKAKVAGFHPHRMRHTFACRYLEDGGSLEALQRLLGHRSIRTTERYAALSDVAVRRDAARVAENRAQRMRLGTNRAPTQVAGQWPAIASS